MVGVAFITCDGTSVVVVGCQCPGVYILQEGTD